MFFVQLAKNNRREWFLENKVRFERECRDPFRVLTVALDPPLGASHTTRINRDLRFSKDKSPYHTHISAVVRGNFLQLSAKGLYVGAGLYMPEPAVLRRLRAGIDDDDAGTDLERIVKTLRRKGYTVATHESVASAPRGFDAGHPRLELLRMKDIHAGRYVTPPEVATSKGLAVVRRVMTDVAPLKEWLAAHVTTLT